MADLLEWEALQNPLGASRSIYDLADFIKDTKLQNKLEPLVDGLFEEDVYEDEDEVGASLTREAELASKIFDVVRERRQISPEQYPFDVQDEVVCVRTQDFTTDHAIYLRLLELTLSHSLNVTRERNPRDEFEEWSVLALGGLGYKSSGLMSQSEASSFKDRLKGVSLALGNLVFYPENAAVRRKQKDAKADVIATHDLNEDRRPGRHFWVGQATCSKSDKWYNKSREVSADLWKLLTMNMMHPVSALLVPHHATWNHLSELAQNGSVPIFDRMRICLMLRDRVEIPELEATQNQLSKILVEEWGLEFFQPNVA